MAVLYVGDSIFKYLDVRNGSIRSLSGARTEDIMPMVSDVAEFGTVVIHVGTNDLARWTVGDVLEGFDNLLSVIRTRAPSVRIVLSAILPRGFKVFPGATNSPWRIDQLNRMAAEVNEALLRLPGLQVVSHPDFDQGRANLQRSLLSRDGLHLSPHGLKTLKDDLVRATAVVKTTARDTTNGTVFTPGDFPPLTPHTNTHGSKPTVAKTQSSHSPKPPSTAAMVSKGITPGSKPTVAKTQSSHSPKPPSTAAMVSKDSTPGSKPTVAKTQSSHSPKPRSTAATLVKDRTPGSKPTVAKTQSPHTPKSRSTAATLVKDRTPGSKPTVAKTQSPHTPKPRSNV